MHTRFDDSRPMEISSSESGMVCPFKGPAVATSLGFMSVADCLTRIAD